MKQHVRNLTSILALFLMFPLLSRADSSLPVGTIIHVTTDQSVSSKDAKLGQRVMATVSEDVTADGKVIIPKGSRAKLSVSSVQASDVCPRRGNSICGCVL